MDSWYDKNKKRAMYKQLYDYFVGSIEKGIYGNNEQLPSRRELIERFNISDTTVLNAYRLLENTGYVYTNPRKGYFVSPSVNIPKIHKDKIPKIEIDEKIVDELIAYSYNGTDMETFENSTYPKIIKEIVYGDRKDLVKLGDKRGEQILRYSIAKWLYSFRNIDCNPEHIIIGAGGEYMLVSLAAVLDDNSVYAVESPGEMRSYLTLLDYGRKVTAIRSGKDFKLSEELNRVNADVVYTYPSYHFPDGYVMSDKQKLDLIEWSKGEPNRYIIEDDTDFGIVRNSNLPIYSMDDGENTIYFGTFRHTIGSSFKLSYMVLPDELYEKWKYHHRYYHALSSKMEQYALAEFISGGEFVKHYRKLCDIYAEKREYFAKLMIRDFGSCAEISPLSDSTSVIVKFDLGMDGLDLRKYCWNRGLKNYNITMYTPDGKEKNGPPVFIYGIGHLSKNEIKYGAEVHKKVIGELLKNY